MIAKVRPNLTALFILTLSCLSVATAGEIHPGLKNAIDAGNVDMAKNIIEKAGVKDIYCPASLSVKEAEKIYASFLKENKLALLSGHKGKFLSNTVFATKYAEEKCNSNQPGDSDICSQWRKKEENGESWRDLFYEWYKAGKGLCQNVETMDNCSLLMPRLTIDEKMDIYRKLAEKKSLMFEKMIEKDTIVQKPIPKKECLANIREYEKMQKTVIGAKKNARGSWAFPFGYCNFDGTKSAINLCVEKLHKSVKEAEKDCNNGKITKDEKKKINSKISLFPLKYEMKETLEQLLKSEWFQMDEKWLENIKFISKFIQHDEKTEIEKIKNDYSKNGDLKINDIVATCKIFPKFDKKIENAIGFSLFNCKQILDKYQSKCNVAESNKIINIPNMLTGTSTSTTAICDKQTGVYRKPDPYESITKSLCDGSENSWMKTYYDEIARDSISLVCDKKQGKFRSARYCEQVKGLCNKEIEKIECLDETCYDEEWQDTKEINTKNLSFEPGKFVDGSINPNYTYFKDFRDNQIYRSVKIGEQIWMAENLKYDDGNLPRISWYYGNDKESNFFYGRLYSWAAAMDSVGLITNNGKGCGHESTCSPTYPVRGICPEGWHLPDTTEWNVLLTTIGEKQAGKMLKIGDFPNWNGTDDYAFSILPAGGRFGEDNYGQGKFEDIYERAFFWTSQENDYYTAYHVYLYYGSNGATIHFNSYKENGFSIRCIKD